MTGPKRAAAASSAGTDGDERNDRVDRFPKDTEPVKLPAPDARPDWAAAMSCPMSCGARHCPFEFPTVWGTA